MICSSKIKELGPISCCKNGKILTGTPFRSWKTWPKYSTACCRCVLVWSCVKLISPCMNTEQTCSLVQWSCKNLHFVCVGGVDSFSSGGVGCHFNLVKLFEGLSHGFQHILHCIQCTAVTSQSSADSSEFNPLLCVKVACPTESDKA